MPLNDKKAHPYDYSNDLTAGRTDLQSDAHYFFDALFHDRTVLDVGAGLGRSKERMQHNVVTTYDIDSRLVEYIDVAGPPMPIGPFDFTTAFDVIEHVEDDVGLLKSMVERSKDGLFVTTPNWHFSKCNSTHHVREYTNVEIVQLALSLWPEDNVRLFGFYKDSLGGWFEMVPRDYWHAHTGTKHGLLVLFNDEELRCIDKRFKGRWESVARIKGLYR